MINKKYISLILVSTIAISATVVSNKLIKWNFDDYTKLTYEYSQLMSNEVDFNDETLKVLMTANLIVSIKDNKYADVIFTDRVSYLFSKDSLGNYIKSDSLNMPNHILFQDLTPEGNIEGSIDQGSIMLAKTLFPITNKKMNIGETTDLKMSMPFNMFGSNINVRGFNRVKYESSDGGILKLSSVIDVSEYTIPEEIDQDYLCYLIGNSSFNFDSDKGIFKDGVINLNLAMGINETDSIKMKKTTKMMMEMNTEIKLKLIKTE
jgi:hypothetical protein